MKLASTGFETTWRWYLRSKNMWFFSHLELLSWYFCAQNRCVGQFKWVWCDVRIIDQTLASYWRYFAFSCIRAFFLCGAIVMPKRGNRRKRKKSSPGQTQHTKRYRFGAAPEDHSDHSECESLYFEAVDGTLEINLESNQDARPLPHPPSHP